MSVVVLLVAAGLWLAAIAALDHDARRQRVIADRLRPSVAALDEPKPIGAGRVWIAPRRLRGFAVLFICSKCEKSYGFGPTDFVAASHAQEAEQALYCCSGAPMVHRLVVVTRELAPQLRPLKFGFGDEPCVVVVKAKKT